MYCCKAVTFRVHYEVARENKREVLLVTSDGLRSIIQGGNFSKELPQKVDAGQETMRMALSPGDVHESCVPSSSGTDCCTE